MNLRRILALTSLGLVVAAAVTGLVLTRPAPVQAVEAVVKPGKKAAPEPPKERVVDESPLRTARKMLPLAGSDEELLLARQAERLANHEVDLAFADALRQAHENPPPVTPETTALLARRDAEEAEVEANQKRIQELTRDLATAASRDKDGLEDQLEVARAELELNQDEMEQASLDLQRAGGDPQARIQRLKAAHNAVEPAQMPGPVTPPQWYQPNSFIAKFTQFTSLTGKLRQLRQAHQEATEKGQKMAQRRLAFAQRVAREGQERELAKRDAAGFAQAKPQGEGSRAVAKATLNSLKHYMNDQRRLGDFGRRLQDQEGLTEVYATWIGLAQTQQRVALHVALKWLLAILGVVLAVMLIDRYLTHLFGRIFKGGNRVGHMLKMATFVTQAVGAVAILFLVFGLPSQMTTLFGLAGAGLTVALKDFIVAFFGWFILVGRNGIHVGDWVEIKGVGGEVVEIGLLRTLLLETGNWNDASHPTGRIASFVNSFAMEGHFFNFSSAGQWLWDELRILVPKDQDPYSFIDAIRALVEKETEANARLAQAEWQQAARKPSSQGISAQPGIEMVPTGSGIELRVRYITRAYERHATQRNLNQALVELLHGKRQQADSATSL